MKIIAENLSVEILGSKILTQVSFQIPDKLFTCILGPNGSGKSTLLRVISKDAIDYSGDITDLNINQLSYLPQNLESPPFLSVLEVASLGFYSSNMSKEEKFRSTLRLLEQCGIGSIKNRKFTDASAGERQRAWLAFALAQSKDVILMDEPLSSVDLPSKKSFFDLLRNIVRTGKTIVIVTHDIDMAAMFGDKIIYLDKGRKTFEGDPLSFQEAYSQNHI